MINWRVDVVPKKSKQNKKNIESLGGQKYLFYEFIIHSHIENDHTKVFSFIIDFNFRHIFQTKFKFQIIAIVMELQCHVDNVGGI